MAQNTNARKLLLRIKRSGQELTEEKHHKTRKLISKYFIVTILLFTSVQIVSQTEKNDLKNIERFCCYEWLPAFKDSISIIVDERKVDQRKNIVWLQKEKEEIMMCIVGQEVKD